MVEKVLPYDRAIVKQDTYYWCGPASTQVVLNSRGINVGESALASELGTTVDGTAHIGLVLAPLNKRLLSAKYVAVVMPNDPPTAAQREKLWTDIVHSIDAGYGLVANIVAPPVNYPRGVNGSASPAYGGGTVFHYIALMGYHDTPDLRAVWVADSGFSPYGYWISLEQLASLIPPKGYVAATANVPAPTTAPEVPVAPATVTLETLNAKLDMILGTQRQILDQLMRGYPQWGPDGSLGKNSKGEERSMREAMSALIKKEQA